MKDPSPPNVNGRDAESSGASIGIEVKSWAAAQIVRTAAKPDSRTAAATCWHLGMNCPDIRPVRILAAGIH
jgi:hypothetical protein